MWAPGKPSSAVGIEHQIGLRSNTAMHWIWKAAVAGLCGTAAHSLIMYAKSKSGLLPSFQPYASLQTALSHLIGSEVHPIVPWALSFLNGSTVVSFVFARTYRWLPGDNGATKGLIYGVLGWTIMGLVFFPLLDLGVFGMQVGLGILPALFSLAMLLTYSIVLGIVYDALNS